MTGPELGQLIERLGRAHHDGELPFADAVAQLLAADPTLVPAGAEGQLRAWRTAAARYAHHTAPEAVRAPVNARSLRAREPIVFRFRTTTREGADDGVPGLA